FCQFFAAFGDNFLKTALVFVILYEVSGANSAVLITIAGATLIAPFFFLSGLGGELADRYDKAFVAQRIKLTEIGAAIVAGAGFGDQSQCPGLDRIADQTIARRSAAVVGRVGRELVLARWGAGALAVAAARVLYHRRQRRSRYAVFDDFFSRGRGRLRPCRLARGRAHRAAADLGRCRAAWPVFARSRLDRIGDRA